MEPSNVLLIFSLFFALMLRCVVSYVHDVPFLNFGVYRFSDLPELFDLEMKIYVVLVFLFLSTVWYKFFRFSCPICESGNIVEIESEVLDSWVGLTKVSEDVGGKTDKKTVSITKRNIRHIYQCREFRQQWSRTITHELH